MPPVLLVGRTAAAAVLEDGAIRQPRDGGVVAVIDAQPNSMVSWRIPSEHGVARPQSRPQRDAVTKAAWAFRSRSRRPVGKWIPPEHALVAPWVSPSGGVSAWVRLVQVVFSRPLEAAAESAASGA